MRLAVDLPAVVYALVLLAGFFMSLAARRREQRRATGDDPRAMGYCSGSLQRYLARLTAVLGVAFVLVMLHGLGVP